MKNNWLSFFTIFLSLLFSCSLFSQNWEFIKEKDGIKLYSKQETGKNLKIFKGVAEIKESSERVFTLLEDVNHTEWWDANLSEIKVLHYEKNKRAQYYLVYNMPWPFKDRDLTVEVTTSINKSSGEYKLIAVPLKGMVIESKNLARIKDYRQAWTVRPVNNRAYVELEFYVDPNENLPNWLLNMVLIDSPINTIKAVRQLIEKKQALNTFQ